MKKHIVFAAVLMVVLTLRVPATATKDQEAVFGSAFFDDLGRLFGQLEHADLVRSFAQAKPIRCADLTGGLNPWKQVAFVNDDRQLANWRRETLTQVRQDLVTFEFAGSCNGASRIAVETKYPVRETMDQYRSGRIPFADIVLRQNPAVPVRLDNSSGAAIFELPYLYVKTMNNNFAVYTLTPQELRSMPEKSVAEEFRCKAAHSESQRYRFMLCRAQLISKAVRTIDASAKGSAGYYILSDGRDATADVKLKFPG